MSLLAPLGNYNGPTTQHTGMRVHREVTLQLSCKSIKKSLLSFVFYRVFIKYCVFLLYFRTFSRLWALQRLLAAFPRCQCVTRQTSRLDRQMGDRFPADLFRKIKTFKGKKTLHFMNIQNLILSC